MQKRFNAWSILFLVGGLTLTIVLARLGSTGTVVAAPVTGHELVTGVFTLEQIRNDQSERDDPPRQERVGNQLVRVTGTIEGIRLSPQGGLTLRMVAEDGTPFTAWAGPDVPTLAAGLRQRVTLLGRRQGELFIVVDSEVEKRLSEAMTVQVAYYKNGWAYCQVGTRIARYPVGTQWDTSRKTIQISYRGGELVVE